MPEATTPGPPLDPMQEIRELFRGLGSQITTVENSVTRLGESVERMEHQQERMERRQERMEHRLEQMEHRQERMELQQAQMEGWQSSHNAQLGSINNELMALTRRGVLTEGRSLENTNLINQIMHPTGTPLVGFDSRMEGPIIKYQWFDSIGLNQHLEYTNSGFTNLRHRLENLRVRLNGIKSCRCDPSLGERVDKLKGKYNPFHPSYSWVIMYVFLQNVTVSPCVMENEYPLVHTHNLHCTYPLIE